MRVCRRCLRRCRRRLWRKRGSWLAARSSSIRRQRRMIFCLSRSNIVSFKLQWVGISNKMPSEDYKILNAQFNFCV